MLYKDMYNIFDAHCHIYPADIAPRAVARVDAFYGGLPVKPRDGTAATLLATGQESGISRFLVHSVATSPHQVGSINRFIAQEVANSGGAFVGLGALHPDSENLESDLHDLILLGLRGVKLHPDIQRFEADAPKAMRLYEICADAGLPVLMHTGDFRFDYSNPNRIANVLRSFPKLKLTGAHLGGWSVWDAAARTLPDFYQFHGRFLIVQPLAFRRAHEADHPRLWSKPCSLRHRLPYVGTARRNRRATAAGPNELGILQDILGQRRSVVYKTRSGSIFS